MGLLPRTIRATVDRRERTVLADWLRGWSLENRLSRISDLRSDSGSIPADNAFEEMAASLVDSADADPQPAAGQIRLLVPTTPATAAQPVLVAILERNADDTFRCAAISPFSAPATPMEITIEAGGEPKTVVSLWNVRSLSCDRLKQSWFVDGIEPGLLERMNTILRESVDQVPHAADAIRDRGARLSHPLDPRHDYLDWGLEIMDRLEDSSGADEEKGGVDGSIIEYPQHESGEALKAAEEKASYGGTFSVRVGADGLFIHFWLTEKRDQWQVRVVDLHGIPSHDLDGAVILNGSGSAADAIFTGWTAVPHDFPSAAMRLKSPDGRINLLV